MPSQQTERPPFIIYNTKFFWFTSLSSGHKTSSVDHLANHPIQMSSTHGMGAREREDGKRRLRCPRLETVHEGHESDEQSLDWWPNPRHAGEALAWSARVSSPDKPTDNKVQGSDAGRTYYLAMARSIRARQAAAAAERDGASARDTTSESDSRKQSEPAKTKPPEQPRMADLCAESPSDGRPVRGVATIQAHPSRTAKAKSVLLVVRLLPHGAVAIVRTAASAHFFPGTRKW